MRKANSQGIYTFSLNLPEQLSLSIVQIQFYIQNAIRI